MKKDERTGSWNSVKLSQCRLKISQRLRERAPIRKLHDSENLLSYSQKRQDSFHSMALGDMLDVPSLPFPRVSLERSSSNVIWDALVDEGKSKTLSERNEYSTLEDMFEQMFESPINLEETVQGRRPECVFESVQDALLSCQPKLKRQRTLLDPYASSGNQRPLSLNDDCAIDLMQAALIEDDEVDKDMEDIDATVQLALPIDRNGIFELS